MSEPQTYNFDKYEFIKSFIKDAPQTKKKSKEKEAALIADVLCNYQKSHLTANILKQELTLFEYKLLIKFTAIITTILAIFRYIGQ